jgi:hypothetical protein
MQYRTFGNTGVNVSALGFGMMRLPILGEDSAAIDEELATTMLHHAIDAGLNYVDTAWSYHREQGEPFVGRALAGGYREKVYLATKLPTWLVHSQDDMERFLDAQLTRLQTDHIDFYLLHSTNAEKWENLTRLKVFDWAERKRAEGKFRYFGFSFHDDFEVFELILNGYDAWDFCQIQYNYMDVDYQAGRKGLQEAAQKGLGVVIMEPLRGGQLAQNPPPAAVAQVFAQSPRQWTPAEWALQWLWNQPEVSLVLSGMSAPQQVEENLASAERSGVGSLTPADLQIIEQVRNVRQGLAPIPCTHCEYCLPCPNDVAIPEIFALYNEAMMYGAPEHSRSTYRNFFNPENKADQCIECGTCESLCPQNIEIIEWLKTAHSFLQPSQS